MDYLMHSTNKLIITVDNPHSIVWRNGDAVKSALIVAINIAHFILKKRSTEFVSHNPADPKG